MDLAKLVFYKDLFGCRCADTGIGGWCTT